MKSVSEFVNKQTHVINHASSRYHNNFSIDFVKTINYCIKLRMLTFLLRQKYARYEKIKICTDGKDVYIAQHIVRVL